MLALCLPETNPPHAVGRGLKPTVAAGEGDVPASLLSPWGLNVFGSKVWKRVRGEPGRGRDGIESEFPRNEGEPGSRRSRTMLSTA